MSFEFTLIASVFGETMSPLDILPGMAQLEQEVNFLCVTEKKSLKKDLRAGAQAHRIATLSSIMLQKKISRF